MATRTISSYQILTDYTQTEEDALVPKLTGFSQGSKVIYNTTLTKVRIWNGTGFVSVPNVPRNTLPALDELELLFAYKADYNNYMEYIVSGGNVTQVNYWSDAGKGTKLYTKDITYSGSNPTIVEILDEISGKTLTVTIEYSGNNIVSITKVLV